MNTDDHGPTVPDPTPADAGHLDPDNGGPIDPARLELVAARGRAAGRHAEAAVREADVLVRRTVTLVANGIDLRNPERLADYAVDQVMDAVRAATLPECGCSGSEGVAAIALIAQLARRVALVEAGR